MVPRLSFPTVDVRDVAKAHISAMREPNANGKRFVVTARTMWIKEIADVLAKEFQSQGRLISVAEVVMLIPQQCCSHECRADYQRLNKRR